MGLFDSITPKPLVQKCCEWSQKLLLAPLSTLDKSNGSLIPSQFGNFTDLPVNMDKS